MRHLYKHCQTCILFLSLFSQSSTTLTTTTTRRTRRRTTFKLIDRDARGEKHIRDLFSVSQGFLSLANLPQWLLKSERAHNKANNFRVRVPTHSRASWPSHPIPHCPALPDINLLESTTTAIPIPTLVAAKLPPLFFYLFLSPGENDFSSFLASFLPSPA